MDKGDATLLLVLMAEMAVSSVDLIETMTMRQSIANNKSRNIDTDKRTLIKTSNLIMVL